MKIAGHPIFPAKSVRPAPITAGFRAALTLCLAVGALSSAGAYTVEIRKVGADYQLLRDGKAFAIKGVGAVEAMTVIWTGKPIADRGPRIGPAKIRLGGVGLVGPGTQRRFRPGEYRLFAYAKDAQGRAATANVPIQVAADAPSRLARPIKHRQPGKSAPGIALETGRGPGAFGVRIRTGGGADRHMITPQGRTIPK